MPENKGKRNYHPKEGEELLVKTEELSPDLVKRHIKKLRLAKGSNIKIYSLEALKYFQRSIPKTTRIGKKAINDMMRADEGGYQRIQASRMFTGRMYLYKYDAIYKDVLPYWDALPLVFFFGSFKSKSGKVILQGLNIHYLPPAIRAKFLLELLKLKTGKTRSAKARLRLSWDTVKAVSKSKACMAAVHNYRIDRIKSKLVMIPYAHWNIVTFLQIAQWKKSSRSNVYKDSLALMKK